MLERLERRLDLLTGGPRDLPERQQTLRQAIAWSCDLLDSDEQRVFERLAVFAGGCSLSAAEAVCDGGDLSRPVLDVAASLVDKSLVRRDESPTDPRLIMLETIREYGLERLAASGGEATVRDRHADYFLALREEPRVGNFRPHLDRLEAERDNLRVALSWLIERREAQRGRRLAGAMWLL